MVGSFFYSEKHLLINRRSLVITDLLTLENKNNTQQDKITWDNLNELEKLIN